MAYANSADQDQTAPLLLEEQSDQGLHCLHFTKYFKKQLHTKQNLGQKSMESSVQNSALSPLVVTFVVC